MLKLDGFSLAVADVSARAGLCLTVASFWTSGDSSAPSYEIYGPQVWLWSLLRVLPPSRAHLESRGSALQGLRKVLDGMGSYADTRILKHRATEIGSGSTGDEFSNELVTITPVTLSLRQVCALSA